MQKPIKWTEPSVVIMSGRMGFFLNDGYWLSLYFSPLAYSQFVELSFVKLTSFMGSLGS